MKGAANLPNALDVEGYDLERCRDKLMLLDVVWRDSGPDYLVRFQGDDFREMQDRDCTGLYFNDGMASSVREQGLKAYRATVDHRIPVFMSTPVSC